jgi:carbonic anhydrase
MERIMHGVNEFKQQVFEKKQALFRELAREQHPKALFITCSDSRIDPALLTQSEPGELFVLRNAGNIIPPHGSSMGIGQEATIDYAIHHLHIEHIIVCGHTCCGAMHALMATPENELSPPLRQWLSCAEAVRQIVRNEPSPTMEEDVTRAVHVNVQVQMAHVATLPAVAAALARKKLELHGWVYCLATGEVVQVEPLR